MKDPGSSKKYFGWTNHPSESARNPEKVDIDSSHYHNIFFTGRNTGKTSKIMEEILERKAPIRGSFIKKEEPKEEEYILLKEDKDILKEGDEYKHTHSETQETNWFPIKKDWIGKGVSLTDFFRRKKTSIKEESVVERKHLYAVGTEIIDSRTEKTLVITSLIPMHHGEEPRYYAKFKNGSCSHIVKESEITLEED